MTTKQNLRPQVGSNGKISALSMVEALVANGSDPYQIAVVKQLKPEHIESLENELDALDTNSMPWTQADLDRRTVLIQILGAAGAL